MARSPSRPQMDPTGAWAWGDSDEIGETFQSQPNWVYLEVVRNLVVHGCAADGTDPGRSKQPFADHTCWG